MPDTWTLPEAADWLDPPITLWDLRAIINALGIKPVPQKGQRHGQGPGRPRDRYEVAEIIRLHNALLPWLTDTPTPCSGPDFYDVDSAVANYAQSQAKAGDTP